MGSASMLAARPSRADVLRASLAGLLQALRQRLLLNSECVARSR